VTPPTHPMSLSASYSVTAKYSRSSVASVERGSEGEEWVLDAAIRRRRLSRASRMGSVERVICFSRVKPRRERVHGTAETIYTPSLGWPGPTAHRDRTITCHHDVHSHS